MKYILTYERSSQKELEMQIEHDKKISKIDFKSLSQKYKNHFFLYDHTMREYSWEEKNFYIVLVKNIEPHNSIYPLNHLYNPKGDNFTVKKNGEICNPGGWGMSETEEGFNNIHFMSALEFYEQHKDLCIKLFEFVINTLNSKQYGEWYGVQLNWFKDVLETIPDLQYIKYSIKYNL
jgi:hypothetical protein